VLRRLPGPHRHARPARHLRRRPRQRHRAVLATPGPPHPHHEDGGALLALYRRDLGLPVPTALSGALMTIRAAILTYIGLMALLAITVASTFVPLGPGNSLINLAVAVAKAALIGAVFMHLRQARLLVLFTVAVLILWIVLMYGFTLNDY